jgi:hypothetical protein
MGMHRSDMTSGSSASGDNMSTRAQADRYQPGVYGPDYLYFGN